MNAIYLNLRVYSIILFLIAINFSICAQFINPVTFEEGNADGLWIEGGNAFDPGNPDHLNIVANPDITGINPSDSALEFVILTDALSNAGMYSPYLTPIEFTEDYHIFKLMIYKNVISPVNIKFESPANGGVSSYSLNATNSQIGKWETLYFDFKDLIGFSYNNIRISPDVRNRYTGTTVYIDNVQLDYTNIRLELGPDKIKTCGDSLTLKPSVSYNGSGKLGYLWFPAEGLTATNILNPVTFVKDNTKYYLIVSSPDRGTILDSVLIQVNPFEAQVEDIEFPCGNHAQLSVSTNYSGTGDLTYNWSPATGLSSSTIANPVVDVLSSTGYVVSVASPNGCKTSTDVTVNVSVIPDIPSICMVTVDENDKNVIVLEKEASTAIKSYFIYRESLLETDQYDLIGIVPYEENSVFTDHQSNARVQSNKYTISIKDICGFISGRSSDHKTIHLSINKGVGDEWNLTWEPYIGSPVSNYKIFRGSDISSLVEIGNTSGSSNSFTDIQAPPGDVYYQIQGILSEPCISLKSNEYTSVRSNIKNSVFSLTGELNYTSNQEFIYPNPASDKLYIKPGNSAEGFIEIYNFNGRMILSTGKINEDIDISMFSRGMYFVKMVEPAEILVNKFVKE